MSGSINVFCLGCIANRTSKCLDSLCLTSGIGCYFTFVPSVIFFLCVRGIVLTYSLMLICIEFCPIAPIMVLCRNGLGNTRKLIITLRAIDNLIVRSVCLTCSINFMLANRFTFGMYNRNTDYTINTVVTLQTNSTGFIGSTAYFNQIRNITDEIVSKGRGNPELSVIGISALHRSGEIIVLNGLCFQIIFCQPHCHDIIRFCITCYRNIRHYVLGFQGSRIIRKCYFRSTLRCINRNSNFLVCRLEPQCINSKSVSQEDVLICIHLVLIILL